MMERYWKKLRFSVRCKTMKVVDSIKMPQQKYKLAKSNSLDERSSQFNTLPVGNSELRRHSNIPKCEYRSSLADYSSSMQNLPDIAATPIVPGSRRQQEGAFFMPLIKAIKRTSQPNLSSRHADVIRETTPSSYDCQQQENIVNYYSTPDLCRRCTDEHVYETIDEFLSPIKITRSDSDNNFLKFNDNKPAKDYSSKPKKIASQNQYTKKPNVARKMQSSGNRLIVNEIPCVTARRKSISLPDITFTCLDNIEMEE